MHLICAGPDKEVNLLMSSKTPSIGTSHRGPIKLAFAKCAHMPNSLSAESYCRDKSKEEKSAFEEVDAFDPILAKGRDADA